VSDVEENLRQRIMDSLAEHVARSGGSVTRTALADFQYSPGESRRLIVAQGGIWNPRDLDGTLSIISDPAGPYSDREEDGLLRYDYRVGSDDGANRKLRRAFELGLPLILLKKLEPGVCLPVFPVYVTADDRTNRQFVVALDESLRFLHDPLNPTAAARRYAHRVAKQRLHQPEFRARVIRAYDRRCAVCSLHHPELLDVCGVKAAAAVTGRNIGHANSECGQGSTPPDIAELAIDRTLFRMIPIYIRRNTRLS
jgi:putative restriction endonuclease